MARSSQTQQKRQRENKLREKAQLKRERRQQRQADKKRGLPQEDLSFNEQPVSAESADASEPLFEPAGADTIVAQPGDRYPVASPSSQAGSKSTPQSAGIGAAKLFVGNLSPGVADQDLADFFANLGFQVASAQVIRDRMTGEPKGFGFVELADGAYLQEAIGRLNGQMLQDRRLTVSEARPQRPGFSGPRGGSNFGGRGRDDFRRRDY